MTIQADPERHGAIGRRWLEVDARASDGGGATCRRCCVSTSHSHRRLRVGSWGGRISRVRAPCGSGRRRVQSRTVGTRALRGAERDWRTGRCAVWADTDAYMDSTAAEEEQRVRCSLADWGKGLGFSRRRRRECVS
jgi:hypothetical protein